MKELTFESKLEERLYNGKRNFTDDELSELAVEYAIETIEGTERRWTRHMESIIQVNDKFFSIQWERGLTEYQENSFDNQPEEVVPVKKLIEITVYESIK